MGVNKFSVLAGFTLFAVIGSGSLSTSTVQAQSAIVAQALNNGELSYDFVTVSQPQRVTVNQRDSLGQNTPISAIQFIVQAKQFVNPPGYFAYFYDADGIEVGFVPVELSPAGSYQANQRVRVTIPLLLLNPNAQIKKIIIRRL